MSPIAQILLAIACLGDLVLAHSYSGSSAFLFEDSSVTRESITHQSMTRRYLDLVPPRATHHEQRNPELRLRSRATPTAVDHAVLILDLDKTCLWGNDGNDLGIAMQWMEKPESTVRQLYKRIISPCVRPAFDEMMIKSKDLHTVIYTRRPQVLEYRSCFRDLTVAVKYKEEWHHDGQIYFPSTVKDASEIMSTYCGPQLLEEEENDVKKALERLLAARDAIQAELGLLEPPPVVVTAEQKDIDCTLKTLNIASDNAVLFDDNKALLSDPKVVCVDPFDAMPESMSKEVLSFMDEHLPVRELEEDLVEYLLEAKPDERSLEMDPRTDQLRWRIPKMSYGPLGWRIPDFEQNSPKDAGVMSPVTPFSQESSGLDLRANHECRQYANLKAAAERAVELRKASSA
eukprot:CAMPEP_0181289830 /NCGR_PEP_ID=MMETSP1101-20121128/1093_1 /TAXON_ID=46948 /ORGANISM="Rhodomonas abbreviata, Strain Caron Lab Isolate" /LENGTH=401 /DNA_ID=CAMNT_0023394081 /DNA_START=189 /DNA_END=1394 /DNA_ORIENTATION=-